MKIRSILFLIASFAVTNIVAAQNSLDEIVEIHSSITSDGVTVDSSAVKPWKYAGIFSLTFSQVSLSNWSAGGENAVSGNSGVLLSANYLKGKSKWENSLEMAYGLTRQNKERVIKNEDKIDFSSQFGRKATDKWFYSALLGFKTQFDKGYKAEDDNTIVSNFLAPAYLLASLGMDYRPDERITFLLSPLTGRLTIVNDDDLSNQGAYGVEPGSKFRAEMGGFVRVNYNEKFLEEKLIVRSRLELFSSYLEKPENIDVSWEFSLDLKLGNYITARLQTMLIYDDDIKFGEDTTGDGIDDRQVAKLQFKEILGIGFSYRF